MKIDKMDKYYNNLQVLLDDASYLLEGKPEGVDDEEFRRSYLASIKLVKITEAQEKASESMEDLLSIISSYSKESAKNSISSISIIDDILLHDYTTYQKVLNIMQNKES